MKKVYNGVDEETIGAVMENILQQKPKQPFRIIMVDSLTQSEEMKKRFQAHLTCLWRHVINQDHRYSSYSREEIKAKVLLRAWSYPEEVLESGQAPWPTIRMEGKTISGEKEVFQAPQLSTSASNITNNHMLTAYRALCEVAGYYDITLPEEIE